MPQNHSYKVRGLGSMWWDDIFFSTIVLFNVTIQIVDNINKLKNRTLLYAPLLLPTAFAISPVVTLSVIPYVQVLGRVLFSHLCCSYIACQNLYFYHLCCLVNKACQNPAHLSCTEGKGKLNCLEMHVCRNTSKCPLNHLYPALGDRHSNMVSYLWSLLTWTS